MLPKLHISFDHLDRKISVGYGIFEFPAKYRETFHDRYTKSDTVNIPKNCCKVA